MRGVIEVLQGGLKAGLVTGWRSTTTPIILVKKIMHISRSPGSPEEFHLQSLTDPYVNLSIHTARASHSLKTL
jgi:hypothetical protein